VAERLARRANQLLERTGRPFWQDESYDHWVRDSKEDGRIISYIEENRHRRGWLIGVVQWSLAGETACPPEPHPSFTESAM
jgi:hypothetical protein